MDITVQNLNFTRYIYGLNYSYMNKFNDFKLIHRTIQYSTIDPNRFDLAYRIQLEPHKKINSNSRGVKYYFSHFEGNRMKDLTGLRATHKKHLLYGDLEYSDGDGNQKKVLLLFQILHHAEQVIVDVFDNYYPKSARERNGIIDNHPLY